MTGGAGFIGSHLVDRLVSQGCEVRVFDDLSSGRLENMKDHIGENCVEFVEGSLLDRRAVSDLVRSVDAVVHLAAIVSVPFSISNPERTYDVNVYGTKVLLDQCVANGVERVVFGSSCAVYGEASYVPIDELHSTDPLSPYAETKLVAEQMLVKDYGGECLSAVALRFFNVYGRRQAGNNYAGVISSFMEHLTRGMPLIIYGDGRQTRDFVHVSDVVEAVWLALKQKDSEGVFNIASGKPVRIRELAKIMSRLVNVEEPSIVFEDPREGDIRNSHGDYSKAMEKLGYQPRKTLNMGLSELLEDIEVAGKKAVREATIS